MPDASKIKDLYLKHSLTSTNAYTCLLKHGFQDYKDVTQSSSEFVTESDFKYGVKKTDDDYCRTKYVYCG